MAGEGGVIGIEIQGVGVAKITLQILVLGAMLPAVPHLTQKHNSFPCFPTNVFQRIQRAVYTGIIAHFYVRPVYRVLCASYCYMVGQADVTLSLTEVTRRLAKYYILYRMYTGKAVAQWFR